MYNVVTTLYRIVQPYSVVQPLHNLHTSLLQGCYSFKSMVNTTSIQPCYNLVTTMVQPSSTTLVQPVHKLVTCLSFSYGKLTYIGSSDGSTILHLACRNGWLKVVKILIEERNVNTYSLDSHGSSLLHGACHKGHLTVVQYLVEKCGVSVNPENNYKETPLHYACLDGHLTAVQYLVEKCRANVNSENTNKETPLHYACRCGRESVVEYLVGIPDVKVTYDRRSDGTTILDLAYRNKWWKVMKILLTEQGVHTLPDGTSPLHRACRDDDVDRVSHILDIGVDPNQPMPVGSTLLDLAHSPSVIRVLLEKGATPAYRNMRKCFPERLQKDPADMAVKMFVVGNPDAGKSTLVKSIENEATGFGSRLLNQLTKVKGVDDKTAGIIPHEIHSKSLGRVILYDFAGHREFYAGHDALLRSSVGNSPSVILVVVDVSNEESQVRETVQYWLGFLAQQNYNGISKPNLLMIGSHSDKISSSAVASKLTVMKSALSDRDLNHFECADPIMLDCRYAERSSMSNLRKSLAQVCQQSRSTEKLQFGSHTFLVFVLDNLRKYSAITIATAQQAINKAVKKKVYWTFLKSLDLLSCCKDLNNQGSILFMTNSDHPEKSWIILDKAALLSRVNGKLFAPEDFKEHQKIANSTGVVPLSKLTTVFPDLDQEMITQFLCHLEFCHEVTALSVFGLLQSEEAPYSENERFFFFPSLVKHETPGDLWKNSSDFDYYTGWILQCSKAEQFLTPRLLQVLLIRLAFQFALVASNAAITSLAIQRKCSVWKNGISWANQSGGEAIVEVVDQKKVIVMTRGKKGVKQPKLQSVHLRSLVMQTVLTTKNEFCPKVEMTESFIYPKDTVEYPINIMQAKCINIKDVASTVKEGKELIVLDNGKTLHPEELFHFEPYASMNELLLKELFEHSSKHHQEISAEFIDSIGKGAGARVNSDHSIEPTLSQLTSSSTLSESASQLVQILCTWKKEMGANGTYCRLHRMLDQYSIFAGRNPLKVAKGELSLTKERCVICTESTASGESAVDGATSNEDIVDSLSLPLPQEKDKEDCSPLTKHQNDFSPDQDTNGPAASTSVGVDQQAQENLPGAVESSTSSHPQQKDDKVLETLLTEADLASVQEALWEGRAKWYNLGLQLALTAGTLDVINLANQCDPGRCFTATLKEWLRTCEHPSWSSLARSLRVCTVGLGELADQIDSSKKL